MKSNLMMRMMICLLYWISNLQKNGLQPEHLTVYTRRPLHNI